jgi:hypothetical protein
MTPYVVYALEVQCSGLAVDVAVNDWRVFREPLGAKRFTQKKLNPWLADGPNVLEVRAALAAGESYLKVALIRVEGDDLPGDDAFVVKYEHKPGEQPLEEKPLVVLKETVDLGPVHGAWAWQTATPYSDGERPAVEAFMRELHGALATKNAKGFIEYNRVKIEEMARALNVPPAELDSDMNEWLADLFRHDDWAMDPFDPQRLLIEPEASRRVVVVTRETGGPPLTGRGGSDELEIPSFALSRLPQGWAVVR